MPAQKRSHEAVEDDPTQNNHDNGHERPEEEEESDRSRSSSNGEKDESIIVKLAEIRKEVQCPICLGIIRKTRTVMECLHRFCRECIDKSMRMGNNECPACRTHCASRRSLRDDPNYDALIGALYPDIDEYEEEELAFHEDEKARNKQIQASIAQTLQRQSEALGRKRTDKPTATAFMRRSQSNYRNTPLRGRRNYRNAAENQGFDDNEDKNDNDGDKDASSVDEHTEPRPKRCKRWGGARYSQNLVAGADGGGDENDAESNRETMGATVGLVGTSERLAWGKGGMRSHTRYGGGAAANGKNARNSRISKLVDHLRNSEENDDEVKALLYGMRYDRHYEEFFYTLIVAGQLVDVHLMLVPIDEQRLPNLQRPYVCCRPTSSVKQLCKYVALQMEVHVDEVEMYMVKELNEKFNPLVHSDDLIFKTSLVKCKDKLQVLREEETLAELKSHSLTCGYLLLAYQTKICPQLYS